MWLLRHFYLPASPFIAFFLSLYYNKMQELFLYGIEHGLLKKDFPVEDFTKMLVDVLYGEMLCWCMSDGAYSFRERTQEYCKNYLIKLLQTYLI